jgi:hypothetical protein
LAILLPAEEKSCGGGFLRNPSSLTIRNILSCILLAGAVINTGGLLSDSKKLAGISTDYICDAALFPILLQLSDFISMLINLNRGKLSESSEKHKEL